MALELVGRVGDAAAQDGSKELIRLGRNLEIITSHLLPRYGELGRRGKVFFGMTAVAGVDHGSSIGTTPAIALSNPASSRKVMLLLAVTAGYVSGTLGAGFLAHCLSASGDTLTSGTAISPVNSRGLSSAAILKTSGTLSAAPTGIRPGLSVGPMLATTALAPWLGKDVIDGEIALEPGRIWSYQGVCGAAGTSPRLVYGVSWIEIEE